jgi:hypothetical protein
MEDIDVVFRKMRVPLPTAYYSPCSGRVTIAGNLPSLVRYALAVLILHEVSHRDYLQECEDSGETPCDDHHEDMLFNVIEEHYLYELDELVARVHDAELNK